ncbi:Bifunctional pyrimidine biosynthesis protein (Pyr ABCN) [Trichuris trichiura]|uniref:Bifunctional pyrimidine biosynthesis protein (Pyr ABCN) n=1 Tax=Trichuris trichiura TaxID=36087 RepID=A0A077ZAN0_TRITR|nr:Bifunctional pyrimidine biosynthesis protein (Pyr ABCN) [Trichuris trichiura]
MNEQVNRLKKAWQTAEETVGAADKLLVYVKLGKPFLSQLELLRFPDNLFAVLIVSTKLLGKISKEQMEKFACTLQVDKGKVKKNWRNLSDVYYDDVATLVEATCALAPFQGGKQLITLEEPLVRMCAHLRTLWGFMGLQEDRVGLFVDKLAMNHHCSVVGLKTATKMLLTKKEKTQRTVEQYGEDILTHLTFPLYVKPQHGCASVGHQLLSSPGQLRQWLQTQWNQMEPYLIEEKIVGEEFTIYMFIQEDKILHSKTFKNEYPIGSFVTDRLPVCKLEIPEQDGRYDMLNAFARRVIAAWSPIPNGLFFIQLFFNPEKEECVLIEVCCRLPGGKYPEALFRAKRIDLEEMHLLANVHAVNFDNSTSGPFMAFFRYPRKAGRVSSLQQPESLDLRSCCLSRWRISIGDILENPKGLAGRHEAISIILLNEDYEKLVGDYNVLVSRYSPFLTE